MHIYIDESGLFIVPQTKKSKVSCVAALAIPSAVHDEVIDGFLTIRTKWRVGIDEIKGSKLTEERINEVIEFLGNYDVVLEICGIDTGEHSEKQVTDFKKAQASKLIESLTPTHHPDVVIEVHKLKDEVLNLSNQLFSQYITSFCLIKRLLETTTWYYSQRLPKELGEFNWIVDAKDTKVTNYENLWSFLILPMLVRFPLRTLEEGNYSSFKRFVRIVDEVPNYLENFAVGAIPPFEVIDIKMIMQESFKFGDSKINVGLQLVDIVASAFTRALNGNLQEQGWGKLGRLMVQRQPQPVQMIVINADPNAMGKVETIRNFHGYVMENITKNSKSMFLE